MTGHIRAAIKIPAKGEWMYAACKPTTTKEWVN